VTGGSARERLAVLLAGHVPGDAVEAGHLDRMRALEAAPGDPFDRNRHDPGHFTASGFVVEGERILLVFHRKLQRWLQPGGHIETADRDPGAAAAREVMEETGLVVSPGAALFDVDVHRVAHDGVEHEHFDLRFLFSGPSGEAGAGDGVDAVRWAGLADLPRLGVDESILRPARRLFGGPP
jgi:8-oxo-dGTP pyrophosphatase MutT (NUDIX family)